MPGNLRLTILIGILSVLFLTGIASAADFSADVISTTQGMVSNGKLYISNDKVRMEMPQAITITRMDKKIAWILMPEEKMYMEQPINPDQAAVTSDKIEGEIERKFVGKEMVDNKMADKYRIIYEINGNRMTVFQWLIPGLAMPVKTAAADNSWSMEYRNIRTESQPDYLFEIPAGYQKFSANMPSMQDILSGM